MSQPNRLPENHPARQLFRTLAGRALDQSSLSDNDILLYLSDLLLHFMWTDNLYSLRDQDGQRLVYLVDMFTEASHMPRRERRRCYKQIGDYTLFILGFFPESLSAGRRSIPQSYYSDAGRRCYLAASELERNADSTVVFRKLADKYERCVLSLNWVREYTSDPFYQFMFREFGIT